MKILLIIIVILNISCCDDNPVNSNPENRSPVILSLTVFPEFVKPNDSLIVICNATDPDGDTLVYDWITTGVVKIKGALPGTHFLYHTYENSRVFYAPDSQFVNAPQDTFWVQVFTRDYKGGGDNKVILFIVTKN